MCSGFCPGQVSHLVSVVRDVGGHKQEVRDHAGCDGVKVNTLAFGGLPKTTSRRLLSCLLFCKFPNQYCGKNGLFFLKKGILEANHY